MILPEEMVEWLLLVKIVLLDGDDVFEALNLRFTVGKLTSVVVGNGVGCCD